MPRGRKAKATAKAKTAETAKPAVTATETTGHVPQTREEQIATLAHVRDVDRSVVEAEFEAREE